MIMVIGECLPREEIFKYSSEKVSEEEKRKIEEHIYGEEIKKNVHNSINRCKKCFKTLAEINTPPDSKILEHLD